MTTLIAVRNQAQADLLVPRGLAEPADLHLLAAVPLEGPLDVEHFFDPGGYYSCGGIPECECAGCMAVRNWPRDDDLCYITPRGVICGGGEKPLHPAWVRGLRDQCLAAGVPFTFLGWGEWSPGYGPTRCRKAIVHPSGNWAVDISNPSYFDGWLAVHRAGQKHSGRELDGQVWDQRPEVSE